MFIMTLSSEICKKAFNPLSKNPCSFCFSKAVLFAYVILEFVKPYTKYYKMLSAYKTPMQHIPPYISLYSKTLITKPLYQQRVYILALFLKVYSIDSL